MVETLTEMRWNGTPIVNQTANSHWQPDPPSAPLDISDREWQSTTRLRDHAKAG